MEEGVPDVGPAGNVADGHRDGLRPVAADASEVGGGVEVEPPPGAHAAGQIVGSQQVGGQRFDLGEGRAASWAGGDQAQGHVGDALAAVVAGGDQGVLWAEFGHLAAEGPAAAVAERHDAADWEAVAGEAARDCRLSCRHLVGVP